MCYFDISWSYFYFKHVAYSHTRSKNAVQRNPGGFNFTLVKQHMSSFSKLAALSQDLVLENIRKHSQPMSSKCTTHTRTQANSTHKMNRALLPVRLRFKPCQTTTPTANISMPLTCPALFLHVMLVLLKRTHSIGRIVVVCVRLVPGQAKIKATQGSNTTANSESLLRD